MADKSERTLRHMTERIENEYGGDKRSDNLTFKNFSMVHLTLCSMSCHVCSKVNIAMRSLAMNLHAMDLT